MGMYIEYIIGLHQLNVKFLNSNSNPEGKMLALAENHVAHTLLAFGYRR